MSNQKIKRVGIDAHMLDGHSGGNETFYENILKNMSVPRGMEIFVFVKKGTDVSELKDKFHIVYFGKHSAVYRNLIELPIICKKYKVEILHAQYFIPFIRHFKTVVTIHDICFEHFNNIFTKREYIRQKLLIPYAAKKSDVIVTVSNFSGKDISETYHIDKNKIIVTENAVDSRFVVLQDSAEGRRSTYEKYGIPENTDYILTVGNLQPRKNIPRLLQAFMKYKEEQQDNIKLVIVGKKAWQYSEIFNSIDKGLENGQLETGDIILTGFVEHEELVPLYNYAAGFIFPSLFEGFGIPPLEAMACGTNIAVSDIPCFSEVAGKYGFRFDPYSTEEIKGAIYKLVKFKDDKVCDAGIEWAREHYSWKRSAQIIANIYKEL